MEEFRGIPEMVFEVDEEKISETITSKTVLITGAGGSIGSALASYCASYKPKCLVLIDNAETPLYFTELSLSDSEVPCISHLTDIRNTEHLNAIFNTQKPDIVFHTAAYKHVTLTENNPAEAISVNVLGTKNLCDLAGFYKVKQFVLVSTDKAVNPISVLGKTKRLAEAYVLYNRRLYTETQFKIVRFGNVLNSNGSVIPTFTHFLQQGKPVKVTNLKATRYFIAIENVCKLLLQTCVLTGSNTVFTFTMGNPVPIITILEMVVEKLNLKPVEIVETGLRTGEKLHEVLYTANAVVSKTTHQAIIAVEEPINTQNIKNICTEFKDFLSRYHSPEVVKEALQKALQTINLKNE